MEDDRFLLAEMAIGDLRIAIVFLRQDVRDSRGVWSRVGKLGSNGHLTSP